MPPRALVTGAGGFVGANLCRRLLHDGASVHAVVRPGADTWRLEAIRGDITFHELDLRDTTALASTFDRAGADWVFHLAAHGAYSWQTDTEAIFTTNTVASAALVDMACARGVEALVQAGTSAEYGAADHPARESELIAPDGAYAVSKAAATRYARAVARKRGAHVVTLRLCSAYGPWEDPNRLLPTLATFGLQGRLPSLADPRTARDLVFVDDVCEAFVRAARATHLEPGAVLNVGSGSATTLAELVDLARAELAIDERPRWSTMAPRTRDVMTCVADPARIRDELGWQPRWSLAEGFRSLAGWLRHDPATRARYEAATGCPVSGFAISL